MSVISNFSCKCEYVHIIQGVDYDTGEPYQDTTTFKYPVDFINSHTRRCTKCGVTIMTQRPT